MLDVEGADIRYGSIRAVRDVSLHVSEGELVGLIGPNGAGKSTLLRTICGLSAPTHGEIRFDGESLVGSTPDRIVARGVALVPEGRRVLASLTVAENLRLGASTPNGRAAFAGALEAALHRFPILRARFHQRAGLLSGGQQQQLAIARALMSRPRLLLLDEPSLGLAPLVVDEMFAALADLRAEGLTMLLVEQKSRRTIAVANRTYVMRSGCIVFEGDSSTLLDGTDLLQSYLSSERT